MRKEELSKIFKQSLEHRAAHSCGSYPYEHAEILPIFIELTSAKRILELGTGLGYTAAFMADGDSQIKIETIDQDEIHMALAKKNWEILGFTDRIFPYLGKAEAILPTLDEGYDLIFFDGHVPSMKFLMEFERLLRKGGLLLTANMYLRDETGGKYMRALQRLNRWKVASFADTSIAIKQF